MPCKTIKKFVVCDKQFIEWRSFIKENQWLKSLETTDKTPINTVSEYYVVEKSTQKLIDKAYIVSWSNEYKNAFRDLNMAWIKNLMGKVEPMDYQQLDNAKENIIDHGGEIYLVVNQEFEVVGTTAMILHEGEFELAKMSVKDGHQGKGYSHYLMREGLAWAKEKNCATVEILTNSLLQAAVGLYKKYGFKIVASGPHPAYERCNLHLRWYNNWTDTPYSQSAH
ncbi:acyl-CoA N-acyltransferase [Sporodiniella umbellata]|nr:acyl-CoA N-acyltransferase [Sporodiniella umbellata]